jgi:hypothetical protein
VPSLGTPLVMDDLHELRLAPFETGENGCSPHAHKTKDLNRRRERVTHRPETNRTASLSDHPNQKRPATAPRQFLLEKSQPMIKTSDFEHISIGNPPTPIVLHGPAPENHYLQQVNYRKKKKTQQPPPVQVPRG